MTKEVLKYLIQKLKDLFATKEEIPTKTSDLTNDNGFITIDEIPKTDLTDYQTKSDATLTTTNKTVVGAINELEADSHTHTNKDILDAITSEKITSWNNKAEVSNIPTKTSDLTNDSGFLTSIPSEYITETELDNKGYLTEHQDISGKVDKINGKGLSTNDYTTEEKNKLSGIEENANNYSLPIASSTVLGGIKIGNGLSIDSNGVLSSSSESSDLSNYQTKTDNVLTTTNKTIVGAINELDIEGIKAEDYNNDPVVVGNNLVARVSALETNESEVLSRVNSLESNKADVSTVSALEASKADVSRVSALETNKADKSSIPTSLPANGGNSNTVGGFSIWVGTQSEYDAITTKSSTTLYFIREV